MTSRQTGAPPKGTVTAEGRHSLPETIEITTRLSDRDSGMKDLAAEQTAHQTRADLAQMTTPPPLMADSNNGISYGLRGTLEVRLAASPADVDAAQALRYHVFYEEMSAKADAQTSITRRDVDRFDAICDHLLVIDHSETDKAGKPAIVGCYRLLRQEVADLHGGFYTAGEYDLAPLFAGTGKGLRFLELGRSCVLPPYRNRPTVELLWHGILLYVAEHKLDVMFGCASFEGTDPEALALPLSYLYHNHMAPPEWHVRALPDQFVEMNRMAKDDINPRDAARRLPPLIKGYLRAGCYIGDGAVVDPQFNTTDVLILFPVAQISERYKAKWQQKYGTPRVG